MTEKRKIKTLEQVVSSAKIKADAQQQSYLEARQQYDLLFEQGIQLENYFKQYAVSKKESIPASLYQNTQNILSYVGEAQIDHKQRVASQKEGMDSLHQEWLKMYQDQKVSEKLLERNQHSFNQKQSKVQKRVQNTLALQQYLVKKKSIKN